MLRLDCNLVFTIINLLILYFLMRKFLFSRHYSIIPSTLTLSLTTHGIHYLCTA